MVSSSLDSWAPAQARRHNWRQSQERRVPDAEVAAEFIDEVGIASLYPASPEVANLFHAHVGDPNAKTESKWDSPSGKVYTWRWTLGRQRAAFYAPMIRRKASFVRWSLLPAVLRLRAEFRTPDELYDFGVISANAYRIARALEDSGSTLSTGEIRQQAGFPTGKESGVAYHKALQELDDRLLITSEFASDEEGQKRHGLMYVRHRDAVDLAEGMTPEDAVKQLVEAYLPAAAYILPVTFAKHLSLDGAAVAEALEGMRESGKLESVEKPGFSGTCYVGSWIV